MILKGSTLKMAASASFGLKTHGPKGIVFRSLSEAKWAEFFTYLGWDWEYEPDLNLNYYIPDFIILNFHKKLLVEVKGGVLSKDALDDYSRKIKNSGYKGDFLILPGTLKDSIGLYYSFIQTTKDISMNDSKTFTEHPSPIVIDEGFWEAKEVKIREGICGYALLNKNGYCQRCDEEEKIYHVDFDFLDAFQRDGFASPELEIIWRIISNEYSYDREEHRSKISRKPIAQYLKEINAFLDKYILFQSRTLDKKTGTWVEPKTKDIKTSLLYRYFNIEIGIYIPFGDFESYIFQIINMKSNYSSYRSLLKCYYLNGSRQVGHVVGLLLFDNEKKTTKEEDFYAFLDSFESTKSSLGRDVIEIDMRNSIIEVKKDDK